MGGERASFGREGSRLFGRGRAREGKERLRTFLAVGEAREAVNSVVTLSYDTVERVELFSALASSRDFCHLFHLNT
jgi:hypothetical protein